MNITFYVGGGGRDGQTVYYCWKLKIKPSCVLNNPLVED